MSLIPGRMLLRLQLPFISDAIAIPLSSTHNSNNSRKLHCRCHVLLFCSLVSQTIFFVTQSGKDGRQTFKYILQCMACILLHNKNVSTDKSKCRLIARKLKSMSNWLFRKTRGHLLVTQNRLMPTINIFIFSSKFIKLRSAFISITYFRFIFFFPLSSGYISFLFSLFHSIFFSLTVVISSFLISFHTPLSSSSCFFLFILNLF